VDEALEIRLARVAATGVPSSSNSMMSACCTISGLSERARR
jgi:hypothetical protein